MKKSIKILSFYHPRYSSTATSSALPTSTSISKPQVVKCQKPSLFLRAFKFCNKILIVGSLYYYTAKHGAWGSPEDSHKFINSLHRVIRILLPYHIKALIWPKDED